MNKRTSVIAGLLLLFAAGAAVVTRRHSPGTAQAPAAQAVKYHCPMHPAYISDKPGKCPICGMTLVPIQNAAVPAGQDAKTGTTARRILYYRSPMDPKVTSPVPAKDGMGMDFVPVYADEAQASPEPGAFEVSAARRQEIGLKLGMAMVRPFAVEVRAEGKVAYDPELYRTQQEYLSAAAALKQAMSSTLPGTLDRARELLAASRLRLRLAGMSGAQIDALAAAGKPDESLLLPSAADGSPWLYAGVYEQDLPLVKPGETVRATTVSLPGRTFEGRIASIDPVLDPATRSARLRARLSDPEGLLKPGMYLNAVVRAGRGRRLTVPAGAVVDTGTKQVVFVDLGGGYLAARRVTAGRSGGGYTEILAGLEPGDSVVTSGNFLIDSESQLNAALSAFGKGK